MSCNHEVFSYYDIPSGTYRYACIHCDIEFAPNPDGLCEHPRVENHTTKGVLCRYCTQEFVPKEEIADDVRGYRRCQKCKLNSLDIGGPCYHCREPLPEPTSPKEEPDEELMLTMRVAKLEAIIGRDRDYYTKAEIDHKFHRLYEVREMAHRAQQDDEADFRRELLGFLLNEALDTDKKDAHSIRDYITRLESITEKYLP